MYLPCSKITIGSKYFGGVHDIKIKRSIHTIGATASVKVPVTAVLRQTGTPPAYVETAQVIKAGDPVEIQLGYDGRLYTEFRGYVKQLNLQTPSRSFARTSSTPPAAGMSRCRGRPRSLLF